MELLRASCKHDPHNRYCLSDWNSFSVDGFSPDYTVSVLSTCIVHIHYSLLLNISDIIIVL